MSLIILFFFTAFDHYILRLHLLHRLLLFYQLIKLCRCSSLLPLIDLNSLIHRNIHLALWAGVCILFGCTAFTNVCASDRALTCCKLRSLLHDTDAGPWVKCCCTVVDKARLCHVVSVPRLIVLSFAATKRSNMGMTCRRLCSVSMGTRYSKLVCRLLSYVVPSVIYNSPNASIIGHVATTLNFDCVIVHGDYFLLGTMSNCLPSRSTKAESLRLDSSLVARVGGNSLALRNDVSHLCILLWLHFKTSSSSGLG